MTIKRRIFVTYVNIVNKLFLKQRAKMDDLSELKKNKISLCFVTISFNNDFLIAEQIRLLKKYIIDKNFVHIIADNSTDKAKRKRIKSVCQKENVKYVALPFNLFNKIGKLPSYSHALSLNWVYHRIIKKIKPEYFGFIDHDIFPIEPYSVIEKIGNQDFFGELHDRTPPEHKRNIWYMWAGFCFFYFDKIQSYQLNFLPCRADNIYLDSGGTNFYSLFSKYDIKKLTFCKPVVSRKIKDGNVSHDIVENVDKNNYHTIVQYIDECWLHAGGGSNWSKKGNKDNFLKEILKQY